MRVGTWLFIAACIPFSTVAYAGPGVWTSGGPYGGDIEVLAVNPSNPATLYAGTTGGVFKSTDSGGTWAPANTGLRYADVRGIAIDPANPSTLYAASYSGGIWKSTNGGDLWVSASNGLTAFFLTAIVVDPANPSVLYAGADASGTLAGEMPVFKSTDAGGSWSPASDGMQSLRVYALVIDPATDVRLYAGTSRGVFRSTDSGGTWASANLGLNDCPSCAVFALAINPVSPATLYAGLNGGGVFRSTDAGSTWTAVNTGLNQQNSNLNAFSVVIDPSSPDTLYTGTYGGGVFKSTNAGNTWSFFNTGLTNHAVQVVAINPRNPATLYAGTLGGVFKSIDSGVTWAATNAGLSALSVNAIAIDPAAPSMVYAGASVGGVFKSTNSGQTWSASNTGLGSSVLGDPYVYALAVDPMNPAVLYAGMASEGIFRSTDSGVTWTARNTGFPDLANVTMRALAIDPLNPATLYAGANYCCGAGGGVFKSVDSGSTWVSAISGLTSLNVNALAINPSSPATLYAGTSGGVFKSVDSGSTWVSANSGLTSLSVNALAINPSSPATLYAGTDGGVFKSTDAGGTWATADNQVGGRIVFALVINPALPSTLYAATYFGGIDKSTDAGGTWAEVNADLPDQFVLALALDPTGTTTLYAGLASGSVWQSTPPVAATIALLPTSAHFAGANGAFFTSNITIANPRPTSVAFTMEFLGNGEDPATDPAQTFTLDSGNSTTFFDIVGSVFNRTSNFGAIRITSRSPSLDIVAVTSTPGFGGSLGQTIPAVSAPDLIPAGSSRSILSIREGDGFRSNLILASSANTHTGVDVSLISPAGSTLATKSYSVPPNGMTQINRVVRDMGVSGPVTGARLVISSSTSGAAFTGIVSVIDEATNDPTTMAAQLPSVPGSGPFAWLLPTSAHSSGLNGAFYTSNVTVANVGAAPASYTFKFLGNNQDGSGGIEQTFNLESGKSVTYFDVLGSVFNLSSSFGALRISSDSPFLNIASVTSTPGFGGTLSQMIPAVFSSDLIPNRSSRSILYIREGDGFRTNLILASAASVATSVDVALVSPAGVSLATKSYSVPPNGMRQINRVVRDMGVSGPVTGARLVLSSSTSTAAFIALASVIDEATNDPTTMEAK